MTLNWQECVVAVLLVLCVIRIVYGIYNFFRRTKNNENPCTAVCKTVYGGSNPPGTSINPFR